MTDSDDEVRQDEDPQRWWSEHYEGVVDQILDFLSDDGTALEGKVVADIGCGDGITDLGLVLKGRPAKLVGYDLRVTDADALTHSARVAGVAHDLPEALSFGQSEVDRIPAPDGYFDVVVTWSVFEHVAEPARMMSEIARVLKPGGVLFLQLWPFWFSEHGGHLWPHYDGGFTHLLKDVESIETEIAGRRATDFSRGDAAEEFRSLNRIRLDDLQRAMLAAGLRTVKLVLQSEAVYIPANLAHLPLSDVGITGVKLLATALSSQPAAAPPGKARTGV